MKKTRKLLALLLALVMTLSLATTAMAATETVDNIKTPTKTTFDIKITGDYESHTYTAYQIFAGKLAQETLANDDKNADGQDNTDSESNQDDTSDTVCWILSDIEWGAAVNQNATNTANQGLIAAIKAITLSNNTKPFEKLADNATAADVADILSDVNTFNAETTKEFAKVMNEFLLTSADEESIVPLRV